MACFAQKGHFLSFFFPFFPEKGKVILYPVSIKRPGLKFLEKSLLNVPYDRKNEGLNILSYRSYNRMVRVRLPGLAGTCSLSYIKWTISAAVKDAARPGGACKAPDFCIFFNLALAALTYSFADMLTVFILLTKLFFIFNRGGI